MPVLPARAAARSTPTPTPRRRRGRSPPSAAGAGLVAVDGLRHGRAELAFVAARPPGHHALADRSMGFCLINNVAVAAAALVAAGRTGLDRRLGRPPRQRHRGPVLGRARRPVRLDPSVALLPGHRPGLRRRADPGPGAPPSTCPLPPGATGDVVRRAFERLVTPAVAGVRTDMGTGVGRVRRPPGRPAWPIWPSPPGTSPSWPGRWPATPPRPGAWSSSSRAATSSTPCAASVAATLGALVGRGRAGGVAVVGGPGDASSWTWWPLAATGGPRPAELSAAARAGRGMVDRGPACETLVPDEPATADRAGTE